MQKNSIQNPNVPVIAMRRGWYVMETEEGRLKMSMYIEDAMVFQNIFSAEKEIDPAFHHDTRLMNANLKKNRHEYAILETKRAGVPRWVKKFYNGKLHFALESSWARRFATRQAAENWIERNAWKFPKCEFRVMELEKKTK